MAKLSGFAIFRMDDMIERKPAYYDAFSCVASACPDSCCHQWEVDIDPETYARYRSLTGELGDRLRAVLREEDGTVYMTVTEGRCPMWRQDGLCEIQCRMGHEALSKTCREFPRLRHDYGDFVELGLELSCPAAAELILFAPNQALIEKPLPHPQEGDYDHEAMEILQESRAILLAFWENAPYSLPQMLTVTLLYAHEVQSALDGGSLPPFSPEYLLKQGEKFAKAGDISGIFTFFKNLEILTPRWHALLEKPLAQPRWHKEMANFVRYGLLRYYYQAVSDYDLLCRVKWLILACLLLAYLPDSFVENAQLFSKEIENSADNMEALWDGAYTCPAFTDFSLLGALKDCNPPIPVV